jgi:hypothetical protein
MRFDAAPLPQLGQAALLLGILVTWATAPSNGKALRLADTVARVPGRLGG